MIGQPNPISEQLLVIRSQTGDETAFGELVRAYQPRLITFVCKMLITKPQDVEDLVQEIWLAIYKDLPALLDPAKFKAWSFQIARNRVFRELRRKSLWVIPLEQSNASDIEATEPLPLPGWEKAQSAIEKLSPPHREVLLLFYLEEMDYQEIANITGQSIGTIRSRLHYAKQHLRALINQFEE